jgi:RNA polymerase sigma-70 factor (ECF subfamily)
VSFEDFYRVEYPAVYRASYLATGDRSAALDATQEAFTRAYIRWWRLSRQDWAGGWVMTTALNLCRRGHAARFRASRPHTRPRDVTQDPSTRLDVARALAELPRRQREVMVLFYIGDLPTGAIAQVMGLSLGTVRAHLAQGRSALREKLEVHDG